MAGVLGLILPSGGPVALLYGFIFSVFCNLCLVASLGELASIWPTAGGQYHYSYMLSTERWKRPASFCVAWLSTAGWLMLVTTEAYFGGKYIGPSLSGTMADLDSSFNHGSSHNGLRWDVPIYSLACIPHLCRNYGVHYNLQSLWQWDFGPME